MSPQSPLRGLFLILAALVTAAMGAAVTAQAAPFSFIIDNSQEVFPDSTVSVSVVKGTGADPVYGFDILIEYDAVGLTLTGVTPGSVFDIPGANEWESFSFTADSSGSPHGLIHIVAVADVNDGSHHPVDYQLADDVPLFALDFVATSDPAYECAWFPIRFYWTECSDNMLALDSLGVSLGISSQVFDWLGAYSEVTDGSYGFPGSFGAPDSCLGFPGVSREIDFYSGGLDILCTDTVDFTGDVNANGIGYEVADFVMFTNYFLYGVSAFGSHPDLSRLASDINYDGNELQWEDLIYLYRVMNGAANPPIGPVTLDTVAVIFTQDDDAKTVTLDYPDSLAALRLVFDGEITPTINVNPTGFSSYYMLVDGRTIVMILPEVPPNLTPNLPQQFVVDGPILTYTGSALLTEASAADFNDRVFHTQILGSGGNLTVPYGFEIGEVSSTAPGNIIQIPIVKTNGSEPMEGFDFLIAYDASAIDLTDVTPGIIFQSTGDYQWQIFNYSFGPFDCGGDCPSGLVRVIGVARGLSGPEPLTQIPDGTTLFTLFGTLTGDPTYAGLFIPARFYWIDCGGNAVAFGATGDSLAVSDHVYDYDGFEITDPEYGLPGYYGAPNSCYANPDNPVRFVNFKNGRVNITSLDSMQLILSIDTLSVNPGDTDVYVDVYVRNPQDSIAGFEFYVQMSRPDMIEFGRSPSDDVSVDVAGTLTENWQFIGQQSLSGTYHDIRIYGISDNTPPYTNAIPPGYGGLLCRLIIHAYNSLPPFPDDSTVLLTISSLPDQTNFADPQGNTIGLVGGAYDPATVAFVGGSVKVVTRPDGDANGDGVINVADAVYLISYIFKGGPAPDPLDAGDANCDGDVNIADAVYLITYIFNSGPPPCSP